MTRAANYHEVGPDTQADITDIDSIIEINGREIATTVQRVGDLSQATRRDVVFVVGREIAITAAPT